MPKVVVKSKYLTSKAHMTEYLKYIATREGVELLPEPVKNRAATEAQRQFIERHLKDMEGRTEYAYYMAHPTLDNASRLIASYSESSMNRQQEFENLARHESPLVSEAGQNNPATKNQREWIEAHREGVRDLLEYEDYVKNPTFGNASELITAIAEYNTTDPEIYLKYIAERPGVYRHKGEAHGLWNLTGKADLKTELSKIKDIQGVAWTHIISLRREDAKRLGYENTDIWRKVVASNADKIAKLYNIDMKNLNLMGAFHNEGHHPHVHLFVYSTAGGNEGIVPKKQLRQAGERMRSMFTNSIFQQDMEPLISRRNDLREQISKRVEAVSQLYKNDYQAGPDVATALIELSKQLPTRGKLQYAYMTPEVKEKTNDTLRKVIGGDKVLNGLTEEYFDLQHTLIGNYNNDPEKIDGKFADFMKYFYEPRSGKFADGHDITTLHNIILRSASTLKDNSRLQLAVGPAQTIRVKSSQKGIDIYPEDLPNNQNADKGIPSKVVSGKIEVERKNEQEAPAATVAPIRLYDAAGNLVAEQPPDESGHVAFNGLAEGSYTVEDSRAATYTKPPDDYFIRYAAVAAVRLIGEELAALCDVVETASKPRSPEKTRKHGRFHTIKKSKQQEEIAR